MNEAETTQDLRELAHFLDAKFEGPFRWRFGWDGILGFIPGIGDLITNCFSFYIVLRAAIFGCPPSVLARMGLNILIDNLLDAIPVLGNFFDFMWKSNLMNMVLLESYLQNPRQVTWSSRLLVVFTLLVIAGVMIGGVWLTFILLRSFVGFLQQAW